MDNNRSIELVIFDMDGLMFDTEKISYESWVKAGERFGYAISMDVFHQTIGANLERTIEIYKRHFGDAFPTDEIITERAKISDDIVTAKGVPVKPGLTALLDHLRANHIRCAVATSTSRKRANKLLELSGVKGYFDCIVCGDEVKRSKPDPEIFLKVCKTLNLSPKVTMVLEDSEAGIEASYKGGMLPVLIPDIKQPSRQSLARAYKVLEDLHQVIDLFH